MKNKKVLHITPWYPSPENPLEAIWIKRHIDSLGIHVSNEILHLQLTEGKWSYSHIVNNDLRTIVLRSPIKSWFIKEIIGTFILLLILLVYYPSRRYSAWNFHIAYPHLVYLSKIQSLFNVPFLITEHWSYYHFHFYSQKKLNRVKSIFKRNIPLIVVSKELQDAISGFCGFKVEADILPNVVEDEIFSNQSIKRSNHYLMAAFWKDPKQPLKVIESISRLKEKGIVIDLKIGGYGPLMESIIESIASLKLSSQIEVLGHLEPTQLALEMNKCKAFILPSKYETFSVICAESLMCGTPVIADSVGALKELISDGDGFLVEEDDWEEALTLKNEFDNYMISSRAKKKFSKKVVGLKYYEYILKAEKRKK